MPLHDRGGRQLIALQLNFHLCETSFHDGDDALSHRAGRRCLTAILPAAVVRPPPAILPGVLSQESLRDAVVPGDLGAGLLAIVLVAALDGRPVDRAGLWGQSRFGTFSRGWA